MSLALLYFQKTPKDRLILAHNSESYIKYPRNFTRLYQVPPFQTKILCNEDDIQDSSVAVGPDGRFIMSINNYEEIPGSEHSQPYSKKSLLTSFIRGKMSSSDFVKSLTSIKVSDYGSFQLVVSDGQEVHLFQLKLDGTASILLLTPGFYSFTSCPAKTKFIKTYIHPWIVQYLQSESTFKDRSQLASTLINILWKNELIQQQSSFSSSLSSSSTITTVTNEERKEGEVEQQQQVPLIPTINKKDEDTTKDVAKEKIPEATTAVARKTINGDMNPPIENLTQKVDIIKRIEQPFVNLLKIDNELYGTSHSYVIINNLGLIDHYESYIDENTSYFYWTTIHREFNMELKCFSERPVSLNPKGFNNLDFSILGGAAGPLEEQIRLKQIYISDAKIAKPPRKRKPYQHRTEKTKGYLTAYNIFARDNRSKIVSELEDNKSMKNNDINRKLGEMWQKISREEKMEYERKSYEDKIRYFKELHEKGIEDVARIKPPKGFEEAIGNEKNEMKIVTKHVARRRKGPFDPKRFKTNYVFFATEQRKILQKKFPKLAFSEIGCIIGEKWRNLSDKDKEKYNRAAEADKERYRREVQEQNDQEIAIETLQNLADSSRTKDDNESDDNLQKPPLIITKATTTIPTPNEDGSSSVNYTTTTTTTNIHNVVNGFNNRRRKSVDNNIIDPDYIEDDILTLANEATNNYINNKGKNNDNREKNYVGMTTRSRSRSRGKGNNITKPYISTSSILEKEDKEINNVVKDKEDIETEEEESTSILTNQSNNYESEEGGGVKSVKGKEKEEDFITHILNAASDMNNSENTTTDKETMEIEQNEKENTNILSNDNSVEKCNVIVSKDQNLDIKSQKRELQTCFVTEENNLSPNKKRKNN